MASAPRPPAAPGSPRTTGGALSAGVVEGFYGPPWSHEERLALLADAPAFGLDTYLYAPKDDPWHRDRWREPYPADRLALLGELAAVAAAAGVRFVWAVAPGVSMRFSDDDEHAALARKAAQVWDAGVRHFAVLFDDVSPLLADPADVAAYGPGPRGTGRAHGAASRRFAATFLRPRGVSEPLLMCPTDYTGCGRTPYRTGLAETLPRDARVLWTGRDVVVGSVTRAEVDAAAAAFGRRLVLWDNYPVNDFDRSRLFLGPLPDRPSDVAGAPLDGIVANAMVEALPSRFALATVGEWARDPGGYSPARAAEAALRAVAGPDAAALAPLVAACRAWPPSASRDPGLAEAARRALAGDAAALDEVERRCRELAAVPSGGDPLLRALGPWLRAARHAGEAGLAACRLLRAADEATRAEARAALARAETDFADVLRPVLLPFAREALRRSSPAPATAAAARRAVLVTGAEPAFADGEAADWLARRGLAVEVASRWPAPAGGPPDLVVLTPRATAEAAAALRTAAVPVLAWGRPVSLGVATESGVHLDRDRVLVGDGEVVVHRGPGRLTWTTPVPGAAVVARTPAPHVRPALVEVPAGLPLADGAPAPAPRTVAFLTEDGPGRWLLTAEGWALLDAALDRLLSPGGTAASPPGTARDRG